MDHSIVRKNKKRFKKSPVIWNLFYMLYTVEIYYLKLPPNYHFIAPSKPYKLNKAEILRLQISKNDFYKTKMYYIFLSLLIEG